MVRLRVSTSQVLPLGTVVDRTYMLESCLGQGGMGAVYRARHVHLNKAFALKLIKPSVVSAADGLRRLRSKPSPRRRPNIVRVTDFGVDPAGGAPLPGDGHWGDGLNDYSSGAAADPGGRSSCRCDRRRPRLRPRDLTGPQAPQCHHRRRPRGSSGWSNSWTSASPASSPPSPSGPWSRRSKGRRSNRPGDATTLPPPSPCRPRLACPTRPKRASRCPAASP
jgi:hypothetical protein